MDIKSFAQSLDPGERHTFVEKAGTNAAYLSQVANGHRKAGTDLAHKMVEASRDLFPNEPDRWLTLAGVRPDVWKEEAA